MARNSAAALSLLAFFCLDLSKVAEAKDPVVLATPVGITLSPLGVAAGYSLSSPSAIARRIQIVYANAEGLTLYTSAADQAGKSLCSEECTKTWSPARVASGASAMGAWTIIRREDGTKQWAFNNKPLYTYVKDVDPGSVGGNSPKRFGRGPLVGPRGRLSTSIAKDVPLPEGWAALRHLPSPAGENLPPSFSISEVGDANGLVIVNYAGQTLYVGDKTTLKASQRCSQADCKWLPAVAPRLAEGKGDFGLTRRDDGVSQWLYKGQPMFTYAMDLAPGDANGIGADPHVNPAYISKYFMPAGVTITENVRIGKVLADTKGMTLYRRSAFITQTGGGHSLRRGDAVRPAVGRELGVNPRCESDCDQWVPLLAPNNAQPQGNWELMTRPDGKKQWAYQGFALWTFAGDKKPGDINGFDRYQITVSHDPKVLADIGTPQDGPGSLYWTVAYP